MGQSQDSIGSFDSKLTVTRRGFVKSAVAVGTAAAMYGCSKSGDGEVIMVGGGTSDFGIMSEDLYFSENPTYRWGTTSHNCGGRCLTRAQVTSDGRIVRFLTDNSLYAHDGSSIDNDNRNTTQSRACSRCRSYKGRLYHPGRLKYPLKQTKARGDVTGFKRISWGEALKDIAARMKAVQNAYGPEAVHAIYACGNICSSFQSASYSGVFASNDGVAAALRLLGGSTAYTSDYSFHQASYIGGYYGLAYSGYNLDDEVCVAPTADDIAGIGKNIILWGANVATTHNHLAFPWVKGIEDMKKRDSEAKVVFIGPELSESGIATATQWIQIRPYTDVALILGMLGEMLKGTFDADGSIAENPMLDVNYLDTMVYGFFDSPKYWLDAVPFTDGTATSVGTTKNANQGQITFTEATGKAWLEDWTQESGIYYINATTGAVQTTKPDPMPKEWYKQDIRWRNVTNTNRYSYVVPACAVDEVPDGKSLSAYIMGADDRITKAAYGSATYIAKKFTDQYAGIARNKATVSYNGKNTGANPKANTLFAHKQDMDVLKDADWASNITGIPAQTIKDLVKIYVDAGKNGEQIWNEWAGGQLKQAEGVITLYALQTLMIITNNWGRTATGVMNAKMGPQYESDPKELRGGDVTPASWAGVPAMRKHPLPSVIQWQTGVKYAFRQQLIDNGYVPNVKDWDINTQPIYSDDGGVKALIKRGGTMTTPVGTFTANGGEYYDYAGRATGTHVVSGFRFILNTGGNIPVNQHANTIDSVRMYEKLPTHGYGDYSVDMAEAFYLVTFDNFMSPSARYSDYVLPAKTSWEQENLMGLNNNYGATDYTVYIDNVIKGPGESKSTWDFARDLIAAYGGREKAEDFTGKNFDTTFKEIVQKAFKTKATTVGDPYYSMTWDEFLEKPVLTAVPSRTETIELTRSATREALDAYLALNNKDITPYLGNITTVDVTNGYGFGDNEFARPQECPQQSRRFHVYSGSLVWKYEHLFDKWHGYLPLDQQGQSNNDGEGDPEVYPIIMYFDYKDYFRKAYGLTNNDALAGRFLMTTTHDRFRAHSSQAENPYLRELTHRVVGGELYSGNDSSAYGISSNPNGDDNEFPALNSLIGADGLPVVGATNRASYADIWVNDEDFASYKDGDLVKVENEIGAVYCTIRKTKRCVPGYVGLHQGCWFDPRTIGGKTVDVGGNCNTLMASRPSRVDHGNAQQSAMVTITKVQ